MTILSTPSWRVVRAVSMALGDSFDWSANDRFTLRTYAPYLFSGDRVHRVAEWDVVTGCVSFR